MAEVNTKAAAQRSVDAAAHSHEPVARPSFEPPQPAGGTPQSVRARATWPEPVVLKTKKRKVFKVKKQIMKMKRRIGISSQPSSTWVDVATDEHGMTVIERCPKSEAEKKMLTKAFRMNKFMYNYSEDQLDNLVNGMQKLAYKAGDVIIQEGHTGSVMYISTSGKVDVSTAASGHICTLPPGTLFGEVAIVHDARRNATIRVCRSAPCTCWSLRGSMFKNIVKTTVESKEFACKKFLRNCSLFAQVSEESLTRLGDMLLEVSYKKRDYIIRQGDIGMSFYILMKGSAQVTKNVPNGGETKICDLGMGDTFGELALAETWTDGRRQANVIATTGVVCMRLGKDGYHEILREMNLHSESSDWARRKLSELTRAEPEELQFENLSHVCTLGAGGFGQVDLVTHCGNARKPFALKRIQKNHIVQRKQQEHILNERRLMMRARSPFVVHLHATYRDTCYVYMLLDACLGGDLFTCRKRVGYYDTPRAHFIVGSVVEALAYLHGGGIAFRDLKPENVLIDAEGRVKLTDFGFARYIAVGRHSWTFCGTPEYLAPELILHKGHSLAVDYWALGVLIFELLTGEMLFGNMNQDDVYSNILKGVAAIEFVDIENPATDIVQQLCWPSESGRLGYRADGIDGIRTHVWFAGFDWSKLQDQSMESQLAPHLGNSWDTSQFDPPVCDFPDVEVDLTEWDYEFETAKQFSDKVDYAALDALADDVCAPVTVNAGA